MSTTAETALPTRTWARERGSGRESSEMPSPSSRTLCAPLGLFALPLGLADRPRGCF